MQTQCACGTLLAQFGESEVDDEIHINFALRYLVDSQRSLQPAARINRCRRRSGF